MSVIINKYIDLFQKSPTTVNSPSDKFTLVKGNHQTIAGLSGCALAIAGLVAAVGIALLFAPIVPVAAPIMVAIAVPIAAFALTTMVLSILSLVCINKCSEAATHNLERDLYDLDTLHQRRAMGNLMLKEEGIETFKKIDLQKDLGLISIILDEPDATMRAGYLEGLNVGRNGVRLQVL